MQNKKSLLLMKRAMMMLKESVIVSNFNLHYFF